MTFSRTSAHFVRRQAEAQAPCNASPRPKRTGPSCHCIWQIRPGPTEDARPRTPNLSRQSNVRVAVRRLRSSDRARMAEGAPVTARAHNRPNDSSQASRVGPPQWRGFFDNSQIRLQAIDRAYPSLSELRLRGAEFIFYGIVWITLALALRAI